MIRIWTNAGLIADEAAKEMLEIRKRILDEIPRQFGISPFLLGGKTLETIRCDHGHLLTEPCPECEGVA